MAIQLKVQAIETMFLKKHEYFILQFPNRCYAVNFNKEDNSFNLFDPNDQSGSASWTRYVKFNKLLQRLKQNVQQGSESYNFHSFEIMSISKAPKQAIVTNRIKNFKMQKKDQLEIVDMPLYERLEWLTIDPIPWSLRANKSRVARIYDWYEDCAGDLYSLFGTISPLDNRFAEEFKTKQTLGNVVVAIGMLQIYELTDWNVAIINSILVSGDTFFRKCIAQISTDDYEIAFEDIKEECVIFPYSFQVRFSPVIDGTLFLVRPKQFNLFKALRMFFDDYERRFGVICVTKNNERRIYAFGKTKDSEYFFYDCETLGPPMFVENNNGVPYVLKATTLNRLLYVMCVTLRGGDFFIFEVNLSKLKSVL